MTQGRRRRLRGPCFFATNRLFVAWLQRQQQRLGPASSVRDVTGATSRRRHHPTSRYRGARATRAAARRLTNVTVALAAAPRHASSLRLRCRCLDVCLSVSVSLAVSVCKNHITNCQTGEHLLQNLELNTAFPPAPNPCPAMRIILGGRDFYAYLSPLTIAAFHPSIHPSIHPSSLPAMPCHALERHASGNRQSAARQPS